MPVSTKPNDASSAGAAIASFLQGNCKDRFWHSKAMVGMYQGRAKGKGRQAPRKIGVIERTGVARSPCLSSKYDGIMVSCSIKMTRAYAPVYYLLSLMKPTPYFFRVLILLSLFCRLVGICIFIFVPQMVPETLRVADEAILKAHFDLMSTPRLILEGIAVLGFAVASIAALIGMFRFKSWARPLNVVLVLALFVVWPFFEYDLSSGLEQAFGDVANILWGAVIAMAYFSPLSELFAQNEG
jgi:hypothetical protein